MIPLCGRALWAALVINDDLFKVTHPVNAVFDTVRPLAGADYPQSILIHLGNALRFGAVRDDLLIERIFRPD